MLVADTLLGDFIVFVVTAIALVIAYSKWVYTYWARRNIPYLDPIFPYGNIRDNLQGKENISVTFSKMHHEMKRRGWKYGGIFTVTSPMIIITDLDMAKNVLTKDFQYFQERDFISNRKDPLQAHLLNLTGNKWKSLRAKLTPTFTSGKMKMMFGVMEECQHDLLKRMDVEIGKKEPINIKEILACFTTNIIGSCAFGLECKALEDENSEFRKMGRKIFTPTRIEKLKITFTQFFPTIAKILNLSLANKETTDFMINMVERTIEYREKNNINRNDFMQSMITLKNQKPAEGDGKPFTLDEVASQCFVFFAAGFETSSTLMTFALYELSKNQDVQHRLRKEITEVLAKHNNKMTYDSIQDMTYLNQVIDGCILGTDVVIEKGTKVTISGLGIHHDEEFYPNPEKFDPERFNEENKRARHNFAFLPFGEGPRNCIGMRFGLLQSKVGLASLVKNFHFTLNGKTEDPFVYSESSRVLAVRNEAWLDAARI